MRFLRSLGLLAAVLLLAAAPHSAAALDDDADDGDLPFPPNFLHRAPDGPLGGRLPAPSLPGRPGLGLGDDGEAQPSVGRGLGEDAPAPAKPAKPPTRAETLDRLFARLKVASDPDEARGITSRVEALWLESGSPTADLLMSRAVSAANRNRRDVAEALFDKLVELEPGWAEAWNRRATLRFVDGDDVGAMTDIAHALALEPRHFGALGGMASILLRHDDPSGALVALRRALAIDPQSPDLKASVDKLVPEVEGREL